MEGKSQNPPASDILRTKRLEVVDDEGRVRAALGTDEEGMGGLTLFDESGKKRAVLEAGEAQGHAEGLALFDADGNIRATLGFSKDGHSNLTILSGGKGRSIKLIGQPDGGVILGLVGEGAPHVFMSLVEEEGVDPYAHLALTDKDGRGGIVLGGRKAWSFVRFRDYRGEIRAGLELADEGELEVTSFGERRRSGLSGSIERVLEDSGAFYRALVFASVLVVFTILGIWFAGLATSAAGVVGTGSGAFPFGVIGAGVFLVIVIASLLLFLARNRE